jgi:hypothetical protein
LGPFGPDTDLRRYGLGLCERGGKNAKKRAAVAVARKLAVLLHRLFQVIQACGKSGHSIVGFVNKDGVRSSQQFAVARKD